MRQAFQLFSYLPGGFRLCRQLRHLCGQMDGCNGSFKLMGNIGKVFCEILFGFKGRIPCLVSKGYCFIDFILQLGKIVLLFLQVKDRTSGIYMFQIIGQGFNPKHFRFMPVPERRQKKDAAKQETAGGG